MNLYVIYQQSPKWDSYDSAIVVANNAEEARVIHPEGGNDPESWTQGEFSCWAPSPLQVKSKYIGKAAAIFTSPCVVLASFNGI